MLAASGAIRPIKGLPMSTSPLQSGAPPRPEDVQVLAAHAGLSLSPAHFAELLDAYGHVQKMLARIRSDRPYADEPAHVFIAETYAISTRSAA
jgi:hypothetical protein